MSVQKPKVFNFLQTHEYCIQCKGGYELFLKLDPFKDSTGTFYVRLTVSTKNDAEELKSLDGKVGFFDNGAMHIGLNHVVKLPTHSFGMMLCGKRVLKFRPSYFPSHDLWFGPSVMQCDTLGKPVKCIGDALWHDYTSDMLFLYDSGNKRFFFKIPKTRSTGENRGLRISFGTRENTDSDWDPAGLSVRFDVTNETLEADPGNYYGIVLRKPEPLGLLMNGQLFFEIRTTHPTYDLRCNPSFIVTLK